MPCADSTDCLVEGKGAICCASEDSQGAVYSVDCSSCTGSREYELCDPDAPAVCASGKSCSAFGALPGYYACQ